VALSSIELGKKIDSKNLLSRIEVVNRREGNLIDAYVPISSIYIEDVPVDESHVAEMTASLQKYRQISPVSLGMIPDFSQFLITDGFHRTRSMRDMGQEKIYANIKPNCTWDDIADLRVGAAATAHPSIKFARLVKWVDEAWQLSPWKDKLKVAQAFSLRYQNGLTGERMGIKKDEVKEIKDWVNKKCTQWRISAPYLYQHLLIAQSADPELVQQVRERYDGHHFALTSQHLGAITKAFPNKFEEQNIIVKEIAARNLTVKSTKMLVTDLAKGGTIGEIKSMIAKGGEWTTSKEDINKAEKPVAKNNEQVIFSQEVLQLSDPTLENFLNGRDGHPLLTQDLLRFTGDLQNVLEARRRRVIAVFALAGFDPKKSQNMSEQTFKLLYFALGKNNITTVQLGNGIVKPPSVTKSIETAVQTSRKPEKGTGRMTSPSNGEIFNNKKKQEAVGITSQNNSVVEKKDEKQKGSVVAENSSFQDKETSPSMGLTDEEAYVIARKLLTLEYTKKELLKDLEINTQFLDCDEIRKIVKTVGTKIGNNRYLNLPDFEDKHYLSALSKLKKRDYTVNTDCKGIDKIIFSCFNLVKIKDNFWEKIFDNTRIYNRGPKVENRPIGQEM
jgi:hypothetical protein